MEPALTASTPNPSTSIDQPTSFANGRYEFQRFLGFKLQIKSGLIGLSTGALLFTTVAPIAGDIYEVRSGLFESVGALIGMLVGFIVGAVLVPYWSPIGAVIAPAFRPVGAKIVPILISASSRLLPRKIELTAIMNDGNLLHPFVWLPISVQKHALLVLFLLTSGVWVSLLVLGAPLTTMDAPSGIVSFIARHC